MGVQEWLMEPANFEGDDQVEESDDDFDPPYSRHTPSKELARHLVQKLFALLNPGACWRVGKGMARG